MKAAGFSIKRRNKNPNIKDRVTSGNAAFCNAKGERRVFVDKNACPVLSDSLVKQVYDKNGLPAKGEGEGDDITDACSYPIHYHFPVVKRQFTADVLRGL